MRRYKRDVDFNVLKGDIDTPQRLKQCSRENTVKSDRGRYYCDTYIRDGDIIHRRAFIKKLRAVGLGGEMRSWTPKRPFP
jgi:hypothetical protein